VQSKQQYYRSVDLCSLSKPPNHHHCNANSRNAHGVFLYPTAYSRLYYNTLRANGEAKFLNGACSHATDWTGQLRACTHRSNVNWVRS